MMILQKHSITIAIIAILTLSIFGGVYIYYSNKQVSISFESELLGAWSAQSGGLEEEIDFSIEKSGIHVYSSFLHQRPAESGAWSFKNGVLTIYDDPSNTLEPDIFDSVTRSGDMLTLKDSRGVSPESVYKKVPYK